MSIAVPPHSVPEPDIVLTSEPDGDGLVPLASVALIVEVADTTLTSDLGRKAHLYALHGIPEYWVADLNARVIHQMWAPEDGHYREVREARFQDEVTARTIVGLMV